ncbi:unnamed protein product [Ascophyllum nodosum]
MRYDLFSQDHYKVLGVSRDASYDTIREAYLKLVKTYHPDINKGAGSADRFKAIASAWEVMGDKSKRAMYDERMGDPTFRERAEQRRRAQSTGSRGQRWSRAAGGRTQMPPILRAFEFATHPRVLMVGLPLACVGYLIFADHEGEEPATITKVDAWLNPATNRWETPAPWNDEFRKRRHLMQKVDRNIVHESGRR